MKGQNTTSNHSRDGEKGAAMVMALLVTFLLLVASTGLILETSKNTANVTDAVAEQQAYNAAESGVQAAVHVLRCQKNQVPGCGNVVANPLYNTSVAATHSDNQIDYVRALEKDATGKRRLSRWLPYNGTGPDSRVILDSNGPSYTESQGYAYSLELSDPDNTISDTGPWVSMSVTGEFFDSDVDSPAKKTYYTLPVVGTTSPRLTIRYTPPQVLQNYNLGSFGLPTEGYGKFTVTRVGTGAVIPAKNRFEITIKMTQPYLITKTIRGWIMPTLLPGENPQIVFDSKTLTIGGAVIDLNLPTPPWIEVSPQPAIGYAKRTKDGDNIISGSLTPPEPIRLLIKSTGYGPRGAKKELQAIIQKNFFNSLTAPAALTLIGPRETTNPSTNFSFNAGQSAVVTYSGADQASTDIIPPIGTTDAENLAEIENFLAGNTSPPFNGSIQGTASNVASELPGWLESPASLDAEMQRLALTAQPFRYFPSGTTPTTFGNYATGQGITFCDGDVTFTGEGGGILVVTGKLTLHGAFSFKGLIIVTGQGGLDRSGGGNGEIAGNVVVAPYVSSRISDTQAVSSTFLAPQYNMDGGGNSTLVYNSQSLANGLTAVSNFVLGVMEK